MLLPFGNEKLLVPLQKWVDERKRAESVIANRRMPIPEDGRCVPAVMLQPKNISSLALCWYGGRFSKDREIVQLKYGDQGNIWKTELAQLLLQGELSNKELRRTRELICKLTDHWRPPLRSEVHRYSTQDRSPENRKSLRDG